jgi:hypothetical protein
MPRPVPPQGPTTASPAERAAQIERWEKYRAQGRTDFIVRRGVLGWGLPAALLTVAYKAFQEQGFVLPPHLTDSLRDAIVLALLLFPIVGALFGRWLWTAGEARYHALIRERDRSPT